MRLTFEDLLYRYRPHSIIATLSCASNRSKQIGGSIITGVIAGQGLIGNAKWTGVWLVELLWDAALIESESNFIEFIGGDICKENGMPYSISLPAKLCMDDRSDIMLCWEMNGERLSPDHGFPLRLIVPGCIGSKSVKWLTKIIVKKEDTINNNENFKLFLTKDIYVPDQFGEKRKPAHFDSP